MQAIQTRYLGPTNYRGSRIVAKADAGRLVVSWNYALGIEENHRAAAEALRDRLGWTEPTYGPMVTGYLPDGSYAHVIPAGHTYTLAEIRNGTGFPRGQRFVTVGA